MDVVRFTELGVTPDLAHKYYTRVAPCEKTCTNDNIHEADGDWICVKHMVRADTSMTSFISSYGEKFDESGTARRKALQSLEKEIASPPAARRIAAKRDEEHRSRMLLAPKHHEHFVGYLQYHRRRRKRPELHLPPPGHPPSEELIEQRMDDIVSDWAWAREFGHYQHALVEAFYNGEISEDESLALGEKYPQYFGGFLHWHADILQKGWHPLVAEWRLFDKATGLPGTIDMAYVDRQGRIILADWKFSKNVNPRDRWRDKETGDFRYFKHLSPPMYDSTFWKYVIQLNAYRLVVHRNTNLRVHSMHLAVFHEVFSEEYQTFEVPLREQQVQQMFDRRMREMPSVRQAQHDEAVANGWDAIVAWTREQGAVDQSDKRAR